MTWAEWLRAFLERIVGTSPTTTTRPPVTTTTAPPVTTTTPPPVTTTTRPPAPDVLRFPAGTVKTRTVHGVPYGFPWSDVSRWEPLFTQAGTEFGIAPLLLAAFAVVESNGNHYRTGRRFGTRAEVVTAGPPGAPSIGIMQVVCFYHAATLPDADCFSPEGNIRLAAKLLAGWIRSEGSWEAALTNKYHPGTDPQSGIGPDTYIRVVRDLIAEVKASWPETTATTTAPPATGGNPYPRPAVYDLERDGARWGVTPAEARRLRGNAFPNRSGARPRYIVLHTQSGNTTGSLDWWLNGPGVQASSTVMIQQDGSVLRVIPERDGPWTNGDVCNPTAKSAGLRALGGNPNIHSLTIEAEGDTDVPYTDAQLRAILWQCAEWMRVYDLPLANLISHASINTCSRSRCPGDGHMIQVVDRLRADGF